MVQDFWDIQYLESDSLSCKTTQRVAEEERKRERVFEAISLFAIYSKNLQATHTWKFVTLTKMFLRMPHENKI